jgi:TetR/AcrR family tetracycline transcriptional repressor
MALDRQMILVAALDRLDQDGIEGVTMRRLANALGVQAPSIYWHYAGKPALVDAMANALLDGVARGNADLSDFRSLLRRSAREFRHALASRRDGALLYADSADTGENMRRLTRATIEALGKAHFDAETATRTSAALFRYTLGFSIEEQARARRADATPPAEDTDASFTFGVDLIVNGLGAPPPPNADRSADLIKAWRKLG